MVRTAVSLAAVTSQSIRVDKIRAGRSSSGLRQQQLSSLQLIKRICNGNLGGVRLGSSVFTMEPGPLMCGAYEGATGTAGSCTLLAHVRVAFCFIAFCFYRTHSSRAAKHLP